MKLELLCHSCKEKFKLKQKASSRQDLILKLGEYFVQRCKHCGSNSEYHVNDVKATTSGSLIGAVSGVLVMVGISVLFWENGYI